jgi:galactokinase
MAYVKDQSQDIVINNVEQEYEEIKITNDPTQKLKDQPGPVNYFLCGYKAILEHNEDLKSKVTKACGLKILIDSNVPPAAGLSSSSAFTVCSAITTAHANGVLSSVPKD